MLIIEALYLPQMSSGMMLEYELINTRCLLDTFIDSHFWMYFILMLFSPVQDKTKEIANLNQQLGLLDLRVVPVTADGNCFFRYIN